MRILPIFAVCLCILLFSCKTDSSSTKGGGKVEAIDDNVLSVSEDFILFFDKFHEDSVFQKKHIEFPIPGLPNNASLEQINDGFFWEASNWKVHNKVNYSDTLFTNNFRRELIPFGSMVVERIYEVGKNSAMERRFAQTNGEWNLIYYAGMNQMKKKEN